MALKMAAVWHIRPRSPPWRSLSGFAAGVAAQCIGEEVGRMPRSVVIITHGVESPTWSLSMLSTSHGSRSASAMARRTASVPSERALRPEPGNRRFGRYRRRNSCRGALPSRFRS